MIYLVLASLASPMLIAWLAFSAIRAKDRTQDRERQQWSAERRELNDRLAHLAGRPWTPAPARTADTSARDEVPVFADVENEPI